MWLDWKGVIIHDVLDNVFFCLVFVLVQVICFQSVVEKSYGSVYVLGWVVGGELEVYGMIMSVKVSSDMYF